MRRTLHIPACDLRVGDQVSFWENTEEMPITEREAIVIESNFGADGDGDYYLKFNTSRHTQFCSPAKQFVLLQEIK